MISAFAADLVMIVHSLFMLLTIFGGLLAPRWPRLAAVHLPALAWSVWIGISGSVCPLTWLEQRLRGDATGYSGSFIAHYLGPVLRPVGLARNGQFELAIILLVSNVAIYAVWLVTRRPFGAR